MKQAIILAGGSGVRLQPTIGKHQKCATVIAGRSVLQRNIDELLKIGIEKIVVAAGYLADEISRQVIDIPGVEVIVEEETLGTGGAVKNAAQFITDDKFIVMNGDTFYFGNLIEYVDWGKKYSCSMLLTQAKDESRYGSVVLDINRIVQFVEKNPISRWISAGIYILNTEFISFIPDGRSSLERDIFPAYINAGKCLHGYHSQESFIDIGTPDSYREAQKLLC
jgi:D-glycero-alpha-D-manno-heptose 1-phosphate guanylyltransferase